MTKWMGKILDRLFAVLCALIFSQFPLFMSQYKQQLIGHVRELELHVKLMREVAAKSDKNLDQYILKFIESEDADFSAQGKLMKRSHMRLQTLLIALTKLENASAFTRPFIFVAYLQWDIFKSSIHAFQPGLSFTKEALLYAFLGVIFGYFFYRFLASVGKKIFPGKEKELSL